MTGPNRFDAIPAARATDDPTSHAAAAGVTASGVRGEQCAAVLAGVRRHPGRTSRELAGLVGLDRHAAARRCADLLRLGLVRKGPVRGCTAGGRPGVTWFAADSTEGASC